ncbi:MAG TPA: hypothetical protein VMT89_18025, partial [Candidatus Acidoferrales bacterium]|nr:hypothetical protein [Candidatus Acidoferrales bacterium]
MGDRRLHILLLSGWFPFPADNGSRIRVANILRQLSQNHRVTLLSLSHTAGYSAEAEPLCDAVHVVPWKDFQPTSRRARCGFLDLRPRSIVDTYSRPMAQSIRAALSRTPYDVVIASQ